MGIDDGISHVFVAFVFAYFLGANEFSHEFQFGKMFIQRKLKLGILVIIYDRR